MKIADFEIGKEKTFIVAELSANHNGSLDLAVKTIEAAARAGADAVKLQTYRADTITLNSDNENFIIKGGSLWDGLTYYQLYDKAYTPWQWHKILKETADKLGLILFSSPFDKTAVDFLEELNMPAYKIASFEINDLPLIEYTAKKNKPVVIPIKSDNLYTSVKNFITEIQPELENYKKCRAELRNTLLDLQELKNSIQQNIISSPERRYLKAKSELLQIIKTDSTDIDISMLQKAIEKKDISACKQFPQPIRGYLNQMIDLQKEYKEIESRVTKKYSYEQQLYARQIMLEKTQGKNYDMLERARYELDYAIKKYTEDSYEKSIKGQKVMKIRVPHFKIGITFSGKYRKQCVEPFCDELLKLGYNKDDIFYDTWHDVLINGIHGDSILRQIYFKNCDCVVVLLSPDYKEKNWTGHIEWSAVKELINTGNDDKICLLRVDSVDIGSIDGLYKNQTIAKAIDDMSASEIAAFIHQKYNMLV